MAAELRRLGLCPLDIEEPFFLKSGPDEGSKVTCEYFREDSSRCKQDQVLGELNCNSLCWRFRKQCKFYDNTWSTSYPAHDLSQQPSISPNAITCHDDPDFQFRNTNNVLKKCTFIMTNKKRAAKRRESFCNEVVSESCKLSCGFCDDSIKDDEKFVYQVGNSGDISCALLRVFKKKRRLEHCERRYNGVLVKNRCILTCGNF